MNLSVLEEEETSVYNTKFYMDADEMMKYFNEIEETSQLKRR